VSPPRAAVPYLTDAEVSSLIEAALRAEDWAFDELVHMRMGAERPRGGETGPDGRYLEHWGAALTADQAARRLTSQPLSAAMPRHRRGRRT